MKKTIAGMLVVLSLLTGCSMQKEVTPQSCITALDINAQMFEYLGRGDIDAYIEYGNDHLDELSENAQDCRSKA